MITLIFVLVTAPIWLICLAIVAGRMFLEPFSEIGLLYWLLALLVVCLVWMCRRGSPGAPPRQ